MFEDTYISFIGSGTMAEAMIRGLVSRDIVASQQIIASGPREERGSELLRKHGARTTTDNSAAAREGHIVVLAVKPQVLQEVLPEMQGKSNTEIRVRGN